jgi:hypothetical protein
MPAVMKLQAVAAASFIVGLPAVAGHGQMMHPPSWCPPPRTR